MFVWLANAMVIFLAGFFFPSSCFSPLSSSFFCCLLFCGSGFKQRETLDEIEYFEFDGGLN